MARPYAIPYFDAHCDTATRGRPLRSCRENHLDLERLGLYAPAAQIMAIFAPPGEDTPETFGRLLESARRELEENADLCTFCASVPELDAAAAAGRTAILLSVEGASLLDCSEAGLLDACRRGIRLVTLVWNKDNRLCGSCNDSGSGLTEDGRRFAEACWELGAAVDLSHASEKTFWDVIGIAKRPVICSHSNAKSLCGHPRNLTDEQIRAVIHNDGCVGINLCPVFLGRGRDMDAILAHMDHFLCLGARENLCLGTDFDGIDSLPAGIAGVESMEDLYEEMLRRRYSEGLVRDIFYHNLRRYMERAL